MFENLFNYTRWVSEHPVKASVGSLITVATVFGTIYAYRYYQNGQKLEFKRLF